MRHLSVLALGALLLLLATPRIVAAEEGEDTRTHVAFHDVHDLSTSCPWLVDALREALPDLDVRTETEANALVARGTNAGQRDLDRVLRWLRGTLWGQGVPADLRQQFDLRAKLARSRVTLEFVDSNLSVIPASLASTVEINLIVSQAASEKMYATPVTLSVQDAPVDHVLDLLAEKGGLHWSIDGEVVRIDVRSRVSETAEGATAEKATLRAHATMVLEAAKQHRHRLEAMKHELEARRASLAKAPGSAAVAQAVEQRLADVEERLERIRKTHEWLEEGRARAGHGRFDAAREALEEAMKRLHGAVAGMEPFDREREQRDREAHARLDHLRAAVHHLHEAGAHEPAEQIERQIREEVLRRVLEELQGLRHEVRALRSDVQELKARLQRERR